MIGEIYAGEMSEDGRYNLIWDKEGHLWIMKQEWFGGEFNTIPVMGWPSCLEIDDGTSETP